MMRVGSGFLILMLAAFLGANGQSIPVHVSNHTVYSFLDEMANKGVIDINSAVKPYSRKFVAERLAEAEKGDSLLTKRQKKDLAFLLKDFGKELGRFNDYDFLGRGLKRGDVFPFKEREKRYDLFYYGDSLSQITINPVLGGTGWVNENGLNYHRYVGAELYGSVWRVGYYANIRDNYEDKVLSQANYLTQRTGSFLKGINGEPDSKEFSDVRGGLTFEYKWIEVEIAKNHIIWGNHYNGSIIHSGRNPSLPYFGLKLKPFKWLEIHYFHAWLSSDVLDSVRTVVQPGGNKEVFISKYMAANMYTFKPTKRLYFSFGNSIIYDERIELAYWIPFLFWKSFDHSGSRNANSQMFFDISSRNIKKLHLSATFFVDELSLRRMLDKEKHTNWWSLKASARVTDLIPNFTLTAEYTRTNPMVYKHFNASTTYETTGYNMGHYLRDNAQEVFAQLDWRPLRGLNAYVNYTWATKGNDYVDDRTIRNPNTGDLFIRGLPFQEDVIWSNHTIGAGVKYEIVNGVHTSLNYQYMDIRDDSRTYTAAYFLDSRHNLSFSLNVGF